MATRSFFEADAKTKVRSTIERIESQTSAEVVVAVRRRVGQYRDVDLACGAALAFVCLLLVIFLDREFSTKLIPLDVGVAFAVGAVVSASTPTLRRALVSGKRRAENTHRAACVSFQELGVSRTSGRNGILVFVSLFERKVAVVHDVGVDAKAVEGFDAAIGRMRAAVERLDPDIEAFVSALAELGPALAKTMPRGEDDVNELPDEVVE